MFIYFFTTIRLGRESLPTLRLMKVHHGAINPIIVHAMDAGGDLHLIAWWKVKAETYMSRTWWTMEPTIGYFMMIVERSRMHRSWWTLANGSGIIDTGYRGEVMAVVRKANPSSVISGLQ
jgi:dUTPase